jgi:hypothetical protein
MTEVTSSSEEYLKRRLNQLEDKYSQERLSGLSKTYLRAERGKIPLVFNTGLRAKFPDNRDQMDFRVAMNCEFSHLEPLTIRQREMVKEIEVKAKRNIEREIRKREIEKRETRKKFYSQIVPSTVREGVKGISQGVVEALKPW